MIVEERSSRGSSHSSGAATMCNFAAFWALAARKYGIELGLKMVEHEYSVLGHSRTNVGRYLGIVAAAITSGAAALGAATYGIAASFLPNNIATHIALPPLTAAIVFTGVHFLFNKYAWRFMWGVLQVPKIYGEWECLGKTIDDNGEIQYEWQADVTITQTWEKICIQLKTSQSKSFSQFVGIEPQACGEYFLAYSYHNEPRQGEAELRPHLGYAEMTFSKNLKTASGDYFNRYRNTAGRMEWTKKQ